MKNFAFIVCPKTIEQLKKLWPITRFVPNFILESRLKNIRPFKVPPVEKIHSIQEKEIQGYIIACPFQDEKFALDKILDAGRLAERLCADIIGLDHRCVSIEPDREYILAKKLKIPVTSGNTLTAWSIFEAIYRIAKVKKIDLSKSTLTITDATNPIGNLCARKLSEYVAKIILVSKKRDKAENLKQTILSESQGNYNVELIIEDDIHKVVKDTDVIILTTDLPETGLDTENLKSNSIICDASLTYAPVNKNFSSKDITIIKGGLIKLPYPTTLRLNSGLPKGIIPASMAEAMLLCLEGRFISYSLGDNINPDKMEEIANIAVQHGFEVWVPEAPLL